MMTILWMMMTYVSDTLIVTGSTFLSKLEFSPTCKFKNHHVIRHNSVNQKPHPNFRAFHRKYMLLSYYMYTAWFYSMYVKSHLENRCFFQTVNFLNKTGKSCFKENQQAHNLIKLTDKKDAPLIPRTPLQNKILLHTLEAMQAPRKRQKNVHFDSDSFDICVDTGTSSTCTPSKEDVISDSYTPLTGATINGIVSGLPVAGYGTIRWVFHDDLNDPIDVEIEKVLHIPGVPTRLLSPQQFATQTGGLNDGFHVGADFATLTFGGFKRCVDYNASNKLPIFASYPGISKFKAYIASLTADGSATDPLTYNQRQLLHWH